MVLTPRRRGTVVATPSGPRPLRAAQKAAWPYVLTVQHPALLMEMRLGKTLLPIRKLRSYYGRNRFLIVAPSSALLGWLNELDAEGVPKAEVALLTGPKNKRQELLWDHRPWNLINREGWRALPEIADVPWDAVVVDESHCLKNPKAGITKFFLKNFRDVRSRWIMTGTIAPESDMEIWSQLAFLDGQAFGHRTYWSWLAADWKPSVTGFGYVPKVGVQSKIRQALASRAFILRRVDVGADVPKVYERRTVEMPKSVRKQYEQVEAEFVLPDGAGGVAKETKTAAAAYHWLRQLCGGHLGDTLVWQGKLDLLVELLTGELARDPVVVWFYYNRELHAAEARLKKIGIHAEAIYGQLPQAQRRLRMDAFQKGRFRVILVQQATAQEGVTFNRADTEIYFSTPLGAVARLQTEDRIVDTERKTPLLVIDLIVPDTVDADAVDMVKEKGARGAWTLQRARAIAQARKAKTQ